MPSFSAISALPARNVTRPIGTLMKKIQCQSMAAVTRPPVSRPMEPPAVATTMKMLIARARSDGTSNSVTMIATITADAAAPPTPCSARAAISSPWLCANPHSTDTAVNSTRPARNTFLRPIRSPRRPASSRKPPNVSRYELTTHVRLAWLKPRSRWIEGSATFTIVASTAIMSWPRHTTTTAIQRRRGPATASVHHRPRVGESPLEVTVLISMIVTVSWTIMRMQMTCYPATLDTPWTPQPARWSC